MIGNLLKAISYKDRARFVIAKLLVIVTELRFATIAPYFAEMPQ
jgi:hypothetical protein